ncbi:MAG: hypothetical protein J6V68_02260 [Clostridia bacterium]|nr:hypothetical protein [Clostridia bacterium]
MKKIITLLLITMISCMTLAFSGFSTHKSSVVSADTVTDGVDVYFIAGQSNAAGYSDFYRNDLQTLNLSGEWLAKAKTGIYTNGFQNVLYFGHALDGGNVNGGNRVETLTPVKAGLGGVAVREIGAELGMAEYFSKHYGAGTENPNKKVVIIKYAVGASSLVGRIDNEGRSNWGAWLTPSYASQSKYTITGSGQNLYENFIGKPSDNYTSGLVYRALNAIKNAGYNNVNLKGLYWSQGEAECTNEDKHDHEPALRALIKDVRTDLGTISSKFMANNSSTNISGASDLDFIISEIATTFAGGTRAFDGYSNWYNMRAVVQGQEAVANSTENTYFLPTDNYTMVDGSANMDNKTENGVSYCGDKYHYSGSDMLEIGNEVGRTFYAVNNNASTSAKITVNSITNDDGQPMQISEVKKISLVAGKIYTADVVNGVANFTNLPIGTYEIVAEGFEQVNSDFELIENQKIDTKTSAIATATIDLYQTPIVLDRDALNRFGAKTDPVHGLTLRVRNAPAAVMIKDGAKGVAFKYNYNNSDTSTYFPAVSAVDSDGTYVNVQLCHWKNALSFKIYLGSKNKSFSISTVKGFSTMDICVYFEGTSLYMSAKNIYANNEKKSDVAYSLDLNTMETTFSGVAHIGFSYSSGAGVDLDGKGTAEHWNIFDIEPIMKTQSANKSAVELTIVGKNIRGVNGVSDANLNGKTAILSSAGGLYNYEAVISEGKASFANVPFGNYELTVDNGNYIGLEKVRVATAIHKEKVRANSKIFENNVAGSGITLNGDMNFRDQGSSHVLFSNHLYQKITYAEAIFNVDLNGSNKEDFIMGFTAKNSAGSLIYFGLRYVTANLLNPNNGNPEYIKPNTNEWQTRVQNGEGWTKQYINGFDNQTKVSIKIKVWIDNGTITLVACNPNTDEEISTRTQKTNGYTTIVSLFKQNDLKVVKVTGLKIGDSMPSGEFVEDNWVKEPVITFDENENLGGGDGDNENLGGGDNGNNDNTDNENLGGGDNGNNDNTDNENTNNNENDTNNGAVNQGISCTMSAGEEYLILTIFAFIGIFLLLVRKRKFTN